MHARAAGSASRHVHSYIRRQNCAIQILSLWALLKIINQGKEEVTQNLCPDKTTGLSAFTCIRRYPAQHYKGDVTVSTATASKATGDAGANKLCLASGALPADIREPTNLKGKIREWSDSISELGEWVKNPDLGVSMEYED